MVQIAPFFLAPSPVVTWFTKTYIEKALKIFLSETAGPREPWFGMWITNKFVETKAPTPGGQIPYIGLFIEKTFEIALSEM